MRFGDQLGHVNEHAYRLRLAQPPTSTFALVRKVRATYSEPCALMQNACLTWLPSLVFSLIRPIW
jgi:hypothetical protein